MVRRPQAPRHVTFWSSGLVTNVRPYICTSAISMATKLDRVVTCNGGTPASRLCELLIMWSRDKWKKKLYLNFHNTSGHQTWQAVTYSQKTPHNKLNNILMTWSRDKYKTLFLHFCSTYDHKTVQSSNLRWGDPTFKVMWPFNYMVTWKMKKTYIYTYTIPMTTKTGRVVTYGGSPPTNSHNLLIMWSLEKQLSFHNT